MTEATAEKKALQKFNFSDDQIELLEEYASTGTSLDTLAYLFKCPALRFKELLENDLRVAHAVYGGRAKSNMAVAAALQRSALEGDVRAQQFWLKNRDGGTWSDRSPEERKADRDAMHPPKLVIALSQDDEAS